MTTCETCAEWSYFEVKQVCLPAGRGRHELALRSGLGGGPGYLTPLPRALSWKERAPFQIEVCRLRTASTLKHQRETSRGLRSAA